MSNGEYGASPILHLTARGCCGKQRLCGGEVKNWTGTVLTSIALAIVGTACKSPEDYRASADREVGAIVTDRRAELGATDDLRVDRPADALRARLLSGEVEVLPPLTLIDSLRIAAENSRAYQTRREALFLEALALTRTRWDFSYQERAGASGSVIGDFDEAQSFAAGPSVGLTKLFASGATFFSDVSLAFTRSLASGDGWDAISGLTLDIAQPLLRGFGSEVTLEPLTQAERDVLYEARAYERFRRTFAFDVASRFYRIREQTDTLRNEIANQESLRRVRERNEAFAQAGRLSEIEVDQARQDELRADDSVVSAQQALDTALDEFKLFLGLPIDVEIALAFDSLDELDVMALLGEDLPEELVIGIALEGRLDYHTTLDRVDDAVRGIKVAEDDLRARLDLTGSLTATSREGKPGTVASDGATWTIGAILDLPIDNLPERNAYRAAVIDLEAAKRDAEEAHDEIWASLRAELRDLTAQRERLEIQTGAVELARRRVESTQLNQEAGRADTRDVLEAQEDLVQAENDATSALTDFTLAGLALLRDMDLLRVHEGGVTVDPSGLK